MADDAGPAVLDCAQAFTRAPSGALMRISVITLAGAEIAVEVSNCETLDDLKGRIEERCCVQRQMQRLLLDSVQLSGSAMTLEELEITDGTALTLVVSGPMPADFVWTTLHSDIVVSEDGHTVQVPGSCCHGGYPVYGTARLGEGRHRWQLRLEGRACTAGIFPDDGHLDEMRHGGAPGTVWTPEVAGTPNRHTFTVDGTVVDFVLSVSTLCDSTLEWCVRAPDEAIGMEGSSGSAVLPMVNASTLTVMDARQAWVPVVKVSHSSSVTLLPAEEFLI